jgi:DNA processing protein
MDDDLIYQLALTQIPQIGSVHARILVQHFGSALEIFKANQKTLEKIEGIGEIRAKRIKQFRQFASGEKESHFIQKYRITPLFMTDKSFPQRLLNCYDHPVLLFYKGAADLNASKIISIVGTRSNSDYGKQFTEKLIKELAEQHVVITSGLAFGIDAISHRAAVRHHLPTLGVVAHGLDQMYPQEHGNLAKEMIKEGGGILSEFRSGVKPDKHNFPGRNRIVAGISDATVVIETGVKGGSMITAELANSYNRDVFAIPGRVTDAKSAGCHHLIKFNKAILLTDAKQLIQAMGWDEKPKETRVIQPQLFLQLSEDEKCIVTMLNEKESLHIDEINLKSGLSTTSIAAAILNLELQSLIQRMPGKLYRLIR